MEKLCCNGSRMNEARFKHFEIERSYNGTAFTNIATLNTTGTSQYQFVDKSDANRGRQIFYRLKKVDQDGAFSYSRVLALHLRF